ERSAATERGAPAGGGRGAPGPAASAAMDQAVASALARPAGDLVVTLPEGEPWACVFARKLEGKRTIVVAMLVDTEPMFERLVQLGEQREERAAHAKSRLLVMGLGGHTVPISDPLLVRGVERVDHDTSDLESFAALVAAMRGAAPSPPTKVDLSQEEAATLEVGVGRMVAALAWRFAVAAGVICLTIVAFGVYVVVATRRVSDQWLQKERESLRQEREYSQRLQSAKEAA